MGRNGEPVSRHRKPIQINALPCVPQSSDEFNNAKLSPQWQWNANHRDDWYSLAARPGWLRVFPQIATLASNEQPNLLLQKLPARSFSVDAALEFQPCQTGEEAGLVITGTSCAMLGIRRDDGRNLIVFRVDGREEIVAEAASGNAKFRLNLADGGECALAFALDGEFTTLAQTFQARKGTWIGAKLGLYSIKKLAGAPAGFVDVDYFRFS
jgi:beta-xylosidase